MTPGAKPRLSRHRIARAFEREAPGFGQHDFLYREMSRRMAERLAMVRIEPRRILDAGCGLGADRTLLKSHYPLAQWFGVDQSGALLKQGQREDLAAAGFLRRWMPSRKDAGQRLCATLDALPLAGQSQDFVWSNAALHWMDDLPGTLAEFNRVLGIGGFLMFSLLGPDTLVELRQAAIAATPASLPIDRAQTFVDMHDVGDMLVHGGFSDPVMDMEKLTLTYRDPWQMLRELKKMGSCVATPMACRGLTSRRFWEKTFEHWPRDTTGCYPLSFELIQGHAWKMAARQADDGRAIIRFMDKPVRNA